MKKNLFLIGMFAIVMTFSFAACSDDDDPKPAPVPEPEQESANLDYKASNAVAWGNYALNVASLLRTDATTLYNDWTNSYKSYGISYAAIFKNHDGQEGFESALNVVEQIIDGCYDIAGEVGSTKIGDPYNTYATDPTKALYQVESWYSWHSRDDYANNIRSIRNAYYGTTDGTVNANSLSAVVATINPELDAEVKAAIQTAIDAILAIPQPFRNNIRSAEAKAAMDACADLEDILDTHLKPYFQNTAAINSDVVLDPVVAQYVDNVVIPTYAALQSKMGALYTAVSSLQASPSDAAFAVAANAWLEAREPWESSEAFLFGPVADKGLDPNMDSWPLDQEEIVNILKTQDWSKLQWSGDYDEDDEAIESVQSVRGFHTLEFLLFKDGQPRKVYN